MYMIYHFVAVFKIKEVNNLRKGRRVETYVTYEAEKIRDLSDLRKGEVFD